jgi:hypothetical protein
MFKKENLNLIADKRPIPKYTWEDLKLLLLKQENSGNLIARDFG